MIIFPRLSTFVAKIDFCTTCATDINPKLDRGSYVPTDQEIACHFSQDHAKVLKLLDFFKNDVKPRVKESF